MSDVNRLLELKETAQEASECLSRFAYAVDAYLGELPPPEEAGYDLEKINWASAEGPSGPYERTDDANNEHYRALRKDLKEHQGKMRKAGYFIWVFENGVTIGRKRV